MCWPAVPSPSASPRSPLSRAPPVEVEHHTLRHGLRWDGGRGHVHRVRGRSGAGKSRLAQVLAGRDCYDPTGTGAVDGEELLTMLPGEPATAGLFLAFQYPVALAG